MTQWPYTKSEPAAAGGAELPERREPRLRPFREDSCVVGGPDTPAFMCAQWLEFMPDRDPDGFARHSDRAHGP